MLCFLLLLKPIFVHSSLVTRMLFYLSSRVDASRFDDDAAFSLLWEAIKSRREKNWKKNECASKAFKLNIHWWFSHHLTSSTSTWTLHIHTEHERPNSCVTWDASFEYLFTVSSFSLLSLLPIQLIGTTCGYFWAELFQSLVNMTNSCDRAGTIANELPIVEQIPVSQHFCHFTFSTQVFVAVSFILSLWTFQPAHIKWNQQNRCPFRSHSLIVGWNVATKIAKIASKNL